MKKYSIFFAASLAAFAVSCNKAELAETLVKDGFTCFTATMGDSIDPTRTALDEVTGAISWTEGDAIKIFWNADDQHLSAVSEPLTAQEASASSVKFMAECTPVGNVYAVYPSTVEAERIDYVHVTVPSVQNGVFADNAILAAKLIDGKFNFQNVCGYLQFSVPAGVTKVVWSADGSAALAGKVKVGFPDGISVEGALEGAEETNITVNVSGAGTYYAAVAPGKYSTMYVAMFNGDELVGEKQTFNTVEVGRAQVKKMGTMPADGTVIADKVFVKVAGAGSKDGSSWDNAMDLAAFKAFAVSEDADGKTIYMAAGKYVIDSEIYLDKAVTVKFFGGYPADAAGTSLVGRDVKNNETVLDGNAQFRILVTLDNPSITVDGLVFQNSYFTGTSGGTALILNSAKDHFVNNCVFRDNHHAGSGPGGALRVNIGSSATVRICNSVFENNVVDRTENVGDGGAVEIVSGNYVSINNIYRKNVSNAKATEGGGGAIRINGSAKCYFDGDLFEGNRAMESSSSAIYCKTGSYVVKCNNTTFIGNRSSHRGCLRTAGNAGKLYLNACTFARDTVSQYASAIHLNSPAAINNCVFYQNINSSETGASTIYHSVNMFMSNSTMRFGGRVTTGIYYVGGVNSAIVNNIFYNGGSNADGNAGSVINMTAAGKNLTSFGHNIIGMFNSGDSLSPVIGKTECFVQNSAEHADYLYVCKKDAEGNMGWCIDPQWVASGYYLKFTEWPAPGKPAEFELATAERVREAAAYIDGASSMAVGAWLDEVDGLNTDRRGVQRSSTAIWPGSYDNSASAEL